MKNITQYILESIKSLNGKTGIIVFDIDDTLLRVDSSNFFVYKHEPGKPVIKLTSAEFALDPDSEDPSKNDWFDYTDFEDEQKVYNSIVTGTPIINNLKIMDAYLNAGYDFCFLTARGCEEVIKTALSKFLEKRNSSGALEKLGKEFKKTLSHAVNDITKQYKGRTDSEKKAIILRDLCKKYDEVVFVDDNDNNLKRAKDLNLKNLKTIKAWEK